MFLRSTKRKKDGKEHRYWSVVENVRHATGPVHQRMLLYLGELNDSQQAAWIKALEIFNADSGQTETRSLFPSDRTPPPTDTPTLSLRLVVTPEGFPLGYEVMPGNTSDKTTLREFLAKIEKQYGQVSRIWIMDRGIPTEAVLAEMRAAQPPVHYLVGTPRARLRQTRGQWEALAWQKIKDTVEVKLFREGAELYVVAKSGGRQAKEIAMRRKRLARLLWALRGMRRETSRDRLLMRLGAAKAKAGRAAALVEIHLPAAAQAEKKGKPQIQKLAPGSFTFRLQKEALSAAELYDGHYLLRSNLSEKEPAWLWKLYMLLVEIEAIFKSFKNDLGLRPIYHSVEPRVEAHIFVCFLAYSLHVTLQQRLRALAPGLTPRAVLETLAGVQMLDLEVPTTDGRWLVMSRYTQPAKAVALLLTRLKMKLPEQPPPRLSAEKKLTT